MMVLQEPSESINKETSFTKIRIQVWFSPALMVKKRKFLNRNISLSYKNTKPESSTFGFSISFLFLLYSFFSSLNVQNKILLTLFPCFISVIWYVAFTFLRCESKGFKLSFFETNDENHLHCDLKCTLS